MKVFIIMSLAVLVLALLVAAGSFGFWLIGLVARAVHAFRAVDDPGGEIRG
jgi:hypothetical protein